MRGEAIVWGLLMTSSCYWCLYPNSTCVLWSLGPPLSSSASAKGWNLRICSPLTQISPSFCCPRWLKHLFKIGAVLSESFGLSGREATALEALWKASSLSSWDVLPGGRRWETWVTDGERGVLFLCFYFCKHVFYYLLQRPPCAILSLLRKHD